MSVKRPSKAERLAARQKRVDAHKLIIRTALGKDAHKAHYASAIEAAAQNLVITEDLQAILALDPANVQASTNLARAQTAINQFYMRTRLFASTDHHGTALARHRAAGALGEYEGDDAPWTPESGEGAEEGGLH